MLPVAMVEDIRDLLVQYPKMTAAKLRACLRGGMSGGFWPTSGRRWRIGGSGSEWEIDLEKSGFEIKIERSATGRQRAYRVRAVA